jgi:hypothetical protein
MATTNLIRKTYAASATGAQDPFMIDWRDGVPSGYTYEVQFDGAATGSVTIESTLDDINDSSITPVWIAETAAITADARGVIGHPVVAIRVNIGSLAGGSLTFKAVGGSVIGDISGPITPSGGGADSDVNLAAIGGTAVVTAGVNGLLAVGGNVASGAADTGNPVKMGGVYSATLPTLNDGQRGNLQVDNRGNLGVIVKGGAASGADGTSNGSLISVLNQTNPAGDGSVKLLQNAPYVFNGATWDRARGDTGGAYVKSNFAFNAPTTVTRPANTTAYSALDVVGGAITFANMGPSGGRIMLTSTQLELDIGAIPSGMSSFFLALYSVTPPSALGDNSPWDLPSGDRASFLGIVQLGSPVDLGSTLYVEQNIINKQIKLAGTSLFGYLVTQTAYTPANNSEVYVVSLHSVGLSL